MDKLTEKCPKCNGFIQIKQNNKRFEMTCYNCGFYKEEEIIAFKIPEDDIVRMLRYFKRNYNSNQIAKELNLAVSTVNRYKIWQEAGKLTKFEELANTLDTEEDIIQYKNTKPIKKILSIINNMKEEQFKELPESIQQSLFNIQLFYETK